MRIDAETSLRDIAFEVCTALSNAGTTAVLTGGGAATLHAPETIQSYDLDFILTAPRPPNVHSLPPREPTRSAPTAQDHPARGVDG